MPARATGYIELRLKPLLATALECGATADALAAESSGSAMETAVSRVAAMVRTSDDAAAALAEALPVLSACALAANPQLKARSPPPAPTPANSASPPPPPTNAAIAVRPPFSPDVTAAIGAAASAVFALLSLTSEGATLAVVTCFAAQGARPNSDPPALPPQCIVVPDSISSRALSHLKDLVALLKSALPQSVLRLPQDSGDASNADSGSGGSGGSGGVVPLTGARLTAALHHAESKLRPLIAKFNGGSSDRSPLMASPSLVTSLMTTGSPGAGGATAAADDRKTLAAMRQRGAAAIAAEVASVDAIAALIYSDGASNLPRALQDRTDAISEISAFVTKSEQALKDITAAAPTRASVLHTAINTAFDMDPFDPDPAASAAAAGAAAMTAAQQQQRRVDHKQQSLAAVAALGLATLCENAGAAATAPVERPPQPSPAAPTQQSPTSPGSPPSAQPTLARGPASTHHHNSMTSAATPASPLAPVADSDDSDVAVDRARTDAAADDAARRRQLKEQEEADAAMARRLMQEMQDEHEEQRRQRDRRARTDAQRGAGANVGGQIGQEGWFHHSDDSNDDDDDADELGIDLDMDGTVLDSPDGLVVNTGNTDDDAAIAAAIAASQHSRPHANHGRRRRDRSGDDDSSPSGSPSRAHDEAVRAAYMQMQRDGGLGSRSGNAAWGPAARGGLGYFLRSLEGLDDDAFAAAADAHTSHGSTRSTRRGRGGAQTSSMTMRHSMRGGMRGMSFGFQFTSGGRGGRGGGRGGGHGAFQDDWSSDDEDEREPFVHSDDDDDAAHAPRHGRTPQTAPPASLGAGSLPNVPGGSGVGQDDGDDDGDTCVICMTERPTITLVPCAHRVICNKCVRRAKDCLKECPICRTKLSWSPYVVR